MEVLYLDREHFDRVFTSHDPMKPDAWKRVAAVQFGVAYEEVSQVQRSAIKSLYHGYVYGMGPREFEGFLRELEGHWSPTRDLRQLMGERHD